MASPSPAPSRAAINALRGVLLTTSCSVIILAEERRRRLNIARTAIDNAKKLHTARVHHNSAGLAESFGRREAFPVEIAHDFSPVAAPKNPVRRRRRIAPSANAEVFLNEVDSIDAFETTLHQDAHSGTTAQTRQKRWDEWDATRKELSRISDDSPFSHNALFLRGSGGDHLSTTTTPERTRMTRNTTIDKAPANSPKEPASYHQLKTNSPLGTVFLEEEMDATAQRSAGQATPNHRIPVNKNLEKPVSLLGLDTLLAELESPELEVSGIVNLQRKCANMLRRLVSSESEEAQAVLSRGIRLLQSTISSGEYSMMSDILHAMYPVCTDVCLIAVPLMDRLLQSRDAEGCRQLLQNFARFQNSISREETSYRVRCAWLTRLLMHYWRKTKDFAEVKVIYGLLQEGGLFTHDIFSVVAQYAIRRRIALIALEAGDDATASEEMRHLNRLRPKAANHDVKLRGRFVVRDAELGRWDRVQAQLATFKDTVKKHSQFQSTLSWLTRIYCQDHSPEETDVFVRDLIKDHEMTLNKPLAFLVMDRHGRNRNLQALVTWLQFCQNGGLEMDQIFFNEIADKCCKYWNLSRLDVVHMLKGVQSSMPWLHDPLLASYSTKGALHDLHKHLPGERESSHGIVSALPDCRGDSLTMFERLSFRCMNTWALQNDWERVYNAYQEAADKGLGFSARCLRLAVVATIHREGPHSCTATNLISKAHADGHDISSALVPLLVARLEAGDGVVDLLQETLSKGQRIHDSVYNKAARTLTQKGQRDGAIKVCEIAARQNGMGELAYSKFNFASLVYCYTGQRRYLDLRSLVTSFTSRSEWWQGSKECKESIKRAMKTIAARVVKGSTSGNTHEEALMVLDDALQHIKSLRATNQQDRETLTKGVVSVFKTMEQPQAFDGGFFPEAKTERQVVQDKRRTPRDTATPQEAGFQPMDENSLNSRQEAHQDDGLAWSENSRDIQTQQQQQKTRRERTPSPDLSEDEVFLERQSLAGAFI
ncbi:hypothetical protein ACJ41O_007845 [Fusarium nematophilum]